MEYVLVESTVGRTVGKLKFQNGLFAIFVGSVEHASVVGLQFVAGHFVESGFCQPQVFGLFVTFFISTGQVSPSQVRVGCSFGYTSRFGRRAVLWQHAACFVQFSTDKVPCFRSGRQCFVSLGFSGQIFIADNDFLPAHNQFEMIVGTQEQSFARKMVLVIGTHLLTAGLYFVNTV